MELCISELNKPGKLNINRTAQELRNWFQLKESFVVQAARKLELPVNCTSSSENFRTVVDSLWIKLLEGNARKYSSKKRSKRFTNEQKQIMEKCFDDGERDKKKRCTTLKCRKIMERELGDEMALSETQIGSYWSAYKSRKNKKRKV